MFTSLLWLGISFTYADTPLDIHQWWLPNQEERQAGMKSYLKAHYGANPPAQLYPQMVVIHWTGVETAKSTWYTFASATLSGRQSLQASGTVNVSAHFLVEQDGTIHQLLPENAFARHCIGFNHLAIGIENVGGKDTLSSAQVEANARLIAELQGRYPIELVIGHHESGYYENHPFFVEQQAGYRSIKADPGADFIEAVRVTLVEQQSYAIQHEFMEEKEPHSPEHGPNK